MRISNRNINWIPSYSFDEEKNKKVYERDLINEGEEEASLLISYESRELLKKSKAEEEREKRIEDFRQLKEMFDRLNKANEESDDQLTILSKCIKIAIRIIQGDHVPEQDAKFLMENNPELYSTAINLRRLKEDPEEWDSVLEDEKEEYDFIMLKNNEGDFHHGGKDALQISEQQIDVE